jgi:hypothetical protein
LWPNCWATWRAEMAQGLDAALPDARFESVGSGVETVVGLMRQPAFAPYSRVWLDIVSAASHGARDHSAAGKHVIDGFSAGSKPGFPTGSMPRPRPRDLF